jgi:hypothetical protein
MIEYWTLFSAFLILVSGKALSQNEEELVFVHAVRYQLDIN